MAPDYLIMSKRKWVSPINLNFKEKKKTASLVNLVLAVLAEHNSAIITLQPVVKQVSK